MANKRVLVRRRRSVRNIRKITRTMQLIATARFQAAMKRSQAGKPYTRKLAELVDDISRAARSVEHPLLRPREGVAREVLFVLTSNRGLCGGYNAHVLRTAVAHLDEAQDRGRDCEVHMVGKKGISYFRFLRRPTAEQITHIGDRPRFEQVEPMANTMIERFSTGDIAAVRVAYMRFESASVQRPTVRSLLPITRDLPQASESDTKYERASATSGDADRGRGEVEYEFSPDPQTLLDELLPATVRVRFFECFTDAAVSEQLARMVAMKAATDAAGDMIELLTRRYNRARQTAITMELLDIVGGANALE